MRTARSRCPRESSAISTAQVRMSNGTGWSARDAGAGAPASCSPTNRSSGTPCRRPRASAMTRGGRPSPIATASTSTTPCSEKSKPSNPTNSSAWSSPPSPRTSTAKFSPGRSPARKRNAVPLPTSWTAGTRRAGQARRSTRRRPDDYAPAVGGGWEAKTHGQEGGVAARPDLRGGPRPPASRPKPGGRTPNLSAVRSTACCSTSPADEIQTGVALMTELGQFGACGRALYDSRPGERKRWDWSGDTP